MNQTRDELIQEAREFRSALGSAVLMDQEDAYGVMADFALKTRTDTLAEVAGNLRTILDSERGMSDWAALQVEIEGYIEKLKQAGGRDD